MDRPRNPPIVLALSGHDPSGGAGIQADIEAIQAQGCHATTAITCLTVQDSAHVHALFPVSADLFTRQALCVLEDLQPSVIKIGLICTTAIAEAIRELLTAWPEAVVVMDPVLRSGAGRPMSTVKLLRPLLPFCTLITPNRHEARMLTGQEQPEDCARSLLREGAGAVLITGADEAESGHVLNTLYQDEEIHHWKWPRLSGSYHGSGCTLTSSLAARLALGEELVSACQQAQQYTFDSIRNASNPGQGQYLPRRIAI